MTGPQRFRSRPTQIEAMQWTGDNPAAMRAFTGVHRESSGGEHMVFTTQGGPAELFVAANDAWLALDVGEWVIQDEHGFYPCKPDVFERKYETVVPMVSTQTYADSTPAATAAFQVRVIAEGEPFDGPILGTVAVTAPPEHVDEVRDIIGRALRMPSEQ